MVLESPVQALNKLFERSPLFGFDIKVLQTDNLLVADLLAVLPGIEKVDSGGIRGIAVGDENDFLVDGCSPDSFLHGNDGRLSAAVVSHMVGGDFEAFGGNEEEGVVMFAEHLDIGFITC